MADTDLDRHQVAVLLGRTSTWFYRHRKRLEAKGFPPPLPTGRWDPEAIKAWKLAQAPAALRTIMAPANDGQDAVASETRALLAAFEGAGASA